MIWVAEFSAKQGTFHCQTLQEAVEKNRRRLEALDFSNDWIIFAMGSREEVSRAIADMEGRLRGVRGPLQGARYVSVL